MLELSVLVWPWLGKKECQQSEEIVVRTGDFIVKYLRMGATNDSSVESTPQLSAFLA